MKPATFDKMIAYIDEHYEQKIELEDICEIGGIMLPIHLSSLKSKWAFLLLNMFCV